MAKLIVVDRSGVERVIDGRPDVSVMEAIRDAGIDELLALCGGGLSCATRHVYVDEACMDLLPPIGEDEDDLLDSSVHRLSRSRLSCQIRFAEAMDGLRVTIAPED